LIHLAWPIVAGQLATTGMYFTDTIMAGHMGANTLAAVALGGSLWSPVMMLIMGILLVLPPFVSQYHGGGHHQDITRIAQHGLYLAVALALAAFALFQSPRGVLTAMGVAGELIPAAAAYLHWIAYGAIGLCVFTALRLTVEGLSFSRPTMVFGVLGLLLNVPLNYVFMYGKLGFPAMGASGCGLATSVVFSINALGMWWYVSRARRFRRYQLLRNWSAPDWQRVAEILNVGLPLGLSIFIEVSLFAAMTLFMGNLGATAVAGHQVAMNVATIAFMLPVGIGMALTVRVGRGVGAGDHAATGRAIVAALGLIVLVQAVTVSVLVLFGASIARLYSSDPTVIGLAAHLLLIAALFQFSDGLQMVAAGALRGFKDTRIPMLLLVVAYWGIGIPFARWIGFSRGLGAPGFWWAMLVGLSVAAALLLARLWWRARQRQG